MADSVCTRTSAQSPDTIFDQWADEGAAARAAQSLAPAAVPRSAYHLIHESGLGEKLEHKLIHLESLLAGMYGFGQDWLAEMNKERRDNIHWLAASMAAEILEAWREISTEVMRGRGAAA